MNSLRRDKSLLHKLNARELLGNKKGFFYKNGHVMKTIPKRLQFKLEHIQDQENLIFQNVFVLGFSKYYPDYLVSYKYAEGQYSLIFWKFNFHKPLELALEIKLFQNKEYLPHIELQILQTENDSTITIFGNTRHTNVRYVSILFNDNNCELKDWAVIEYAYTILPPFTINFPTISRAISKKVIFNSGDGINVIEFSFKDNINHETNNCENTYTSGNCFINEHIINNIKNEEKINFEGGDDDNNNHFSSSLYVKLVDSQAFDKSIHIRNVNFTFPEFMDGKFQQLQGWKYQFEDFNLQLLEVSRTEVITFAAHVFLSNTTPKFKDLFLKKMYLNLDSAGVVSLISQSSLVQMELPLTDVINKSVRILNLEASDSCKNDIHLYPKTFLLTNNNVLKGISVSNIKHNIYPIAIVL